jgi:hypothetical protein
MCAHVSVTITLGVLFIFFSPLFLFTVKGIERTHQVCSDRMIERNVYLRCKPSTAKYGDLAVRNYVSTLDLWIVSHGAVGSNNLIEHLENRTKLKLRSDMTKYQVSCHYPYLLKNIKRKTRVLYIAGNVRHALESMNRRSFLIPNVIKINFGGTGRCRYLTSCWEEWINARLNTHATDPLGIEAQVTSFLSSNSSRVGFLRYPYCRNDVVEIFSKLRLFEYGEARQVFADFECKKKHSTQRSHSFTYKARMINYDILDNALMSIPTASLTNEKEFATKVREHFD